MNLNFLIWEQGWQTAGWTMVYFLALGTLVVLLAAPLRWLLRRANPTFRYTTSLAVFAVLALLPVGIGLWLSQTPASELPLAELAPAPIPQVIDLADTPFETDAAAVRLQAPNEQPPSEPTENATVWTVAQAVEYFPWVWLIGTPLTFLLLATGLIGAERLRRASQIVEAGPVHEAADRLRDALDVGRRVTVAICDRLATPLVVGIVRPLILLPPAALTGWSTDELEMVLLHELAHIRRWDNLVNLLQRVVESLLFFHPAVWIASRWVRRDREDCCDAVVVGRTAKPQAYAELLVALASPSHSLAGLAMARHPLAGRIRRIMHLEDETMLVSRNTLVAISTALLAIVLTVSCYSPRETEAEEATGRINSEEQVESVVDKVTEPGKTMVQFFPHPTTSEVVSEAVKKLNKIGHNVTIRPTEHGTALLIQDGILRSPGRVREAPTKADVLQPGDVVHLRVSGALPSDPLNGQFRVEPMGTLALGPLYGRVKVSGHSLLEAEEVVLVNLKKILSDPMVQLTLLMKALKPSAEESPQQAKSATLLYDGKTFDEWRALWKTELKTENRIDCIKALAAFGRAGKGKEAAEAILEIVQEYDWLFIRVGSLGSLQQSAIGAMGGADYGQGIRPIPIDDWLPVVTKYVLAGNKRVIAFAHSVYPVAWMDAMRNSDKEARQRINQAFKDMGPDAIPYVRQHLLSIESMGRTTPDTDGKVQTQETKISTVAADFLYEITGSDEIAIELLESVVGRKDTFYPRDLEQEKFLLERLKSRQER